jgi:hypothetical protein
MYLPDALNALYEVEHTFTEIESTDSFEAFTAREKAQYGDVLGRLRNLIHDLEQEYAGGIGLVTLSLQQLRIRQHNADANHSRNPRR